MLLALAFMFSICSLQYQQPVATTPSEHSLVREDDTVAISPAMIAFFNGNTAPVEKNTTIPKWRLPGPELKQKGNGMRMTIILVAGVLSGTIGVGLLVAAMMNFAIHTHKSRLEVQLGAV